MQKANLPRWKSCVASGLRSPEKKWNTGRKKRRNGSDSGSLLIHSKGESPSSSTGARNQAITEFERSRLKTIAAAWKQRICKAAVGIIGRQICKVGQCCDVRLSHATGVGYGVVWGGIFSGCARLDFAVFGRCHQPSRRHWRYFVRHPIQPRGPVCEAAVVL
jgi:hypothetical protein